MCWTPSGSRFTCLSFFSSDLCVFLRLEPCFSLCSSLTNSHSSIWSSSGIPISKVFQQMAQDLPEKPTSWWKKPACKEWGLALGKAQKTEQREQFHWRPTWQASKFVWVVYRIVGDSKASLRNALELWEWLRSSIPGALLGNCRQLDRPEELFSPEVPKACITMGCTLWILDVAGTSWDLRVIFEPGNLVCFPSFNKPPSRSRAKMGYLISEESAPGHRNGKTAQISDCQEPGG